MKPQKLAALLTAVAVAASLCVPVQAEIPTTNTSVFAQSQETNVVTITTSSSLKAKTSLDTSIYGYDLEDNMINEQPIIDSFYITCSLVNVHGFVNNLNLDTEFSLVGTVYKTFDNNLFCEVKDASGNYDVVFTCLEKKQQHNDYVLLRNVDESTIYKGDYGLKIYLMKKGTRDISIIEDENIVIDYLDEILLNCDETEYSNLNWFANCFEPIPENNELPFSTTTKEYTYWDTDTYYFGTVWAKMGFKLSSTLDTPSLPNSFGTKLEFEWIVDASDPAYNNPYRADGYFKVQNIRAESLIGQGNYLQSIMWNGQGATTLSASLSLSLYIGYGSILGGSVSYTTSPTTFPKANWLYLIDSNCSDTVKPRQAKTTYTSLVLSKPTHYADLLVDPVSMSTNSSFNYYQTLWTFDVYKKSSSTSYNLNKSNQTLTSGSYFY